MTSHGEYSSDKLDKLINVGLCSLNISMHVASPDQYLNLDLVAQNVRAKHGETKGRRFAQSKYEQKIKTIHAALIHQESHPSFSVKVNCVVVSKESALEVVRFCAAHNVPCRLQADINNVELSRQFISELLSELNARHVMTERSLGDSSSAGNYYTFQYDAKGGQIRDVRIKVKSFEPLWLPEMCSACDLIHTSACRENFYGIRIEVSETGELLVRLCIDRTEMGVTVYKLRDFMDLISVAGTIPHSAIESYHQGTRLLWKRMVIEAFYQRLQESTSTLHRGAQSASSEARLGYTARESRYDTAQVEASWLANALERMSNSSDLQALPIEYANTVSLGSLQYLRFDDDDDGFSGWYLLAEKPLEVNVQGEKVSSVTSRSDLGKAISGLRSGERFSYFIGDRECSGIIEQLF